VHANDGDPTRRAILAATGFGVSAALAGTAPNAAEAGESFWTHEYWAKKGAVSLYMYRKRRAAPVKGEKALPILFLVHGSSISSRPSFDLTVPGAGEYSIMNVFARLGFDVWTMDFEGYGRSTVTAGNSDIKSGVEDLRAAMTVLEAETGEKNASFLGESSGALRACAFAEAEPERADRLVLVALTYTGKGSPTLAKRGEQVEFFRTHNRRPRDRAMIDSIFTRDKSGTTDPRVPEALAKAELPLGDTVPTGTYLDMTANLPVVDPTRVKSPVQIVRGQYDGIATDADLLDFYEKLPNQDRQYVVIAGAAHSVGSSYNRAKFWHMAHAFLTMPPGRTV
jgi:pimeloyl-ACP methyl ester carboxylesterase